MNRRNFLKGLAAGILPMESIIEILSQQQLAAAQVARFIDTATGKDWLVRWENILSASS